MSATLSVGLPSSADLRALRAEFDARWAEQCSTFRLEGFSDSVWRYSREERPDDPEQGWKLHISATVLTAGRVLEAVAPLLSRRGVLFKVPATLDELDKLNSGLYYGYSQVGKFLTIYPRTDAEAVLLARSLHRLTRGLAAPSIPFDLQYRPDSCVYYRYGAFKTIELGQADGSSLFAVRDPEGILVPDLRDSAVQPTWTVNPFPPKRRARTKAEPPSPLKFTFKAFRALAQRGKGGVYQALDLSARPPQLCILKEGRKDGEVDWAGRDGFWRVRHEGQVLNALCKSGVDVPRVYSEFEADRNYYLAVELVEGVNLEDWLARRRRRLPLARCLQYSAALAFLLAHIHAAGWVWRDCKPRNIVVTVDGRLRPLDFEGACLVNQSDPLPWGTPSYIPPEWGIETEGRSRLPEDLYALGVILHLLLAGRTPDATPARPLDKLRCRVPVAVQTLLAELLSPDPRNRPVAAVAGRRLKAAFDSITKGRARKPRQRGERTRRTSAA